MGSLQPPRILKYPLDAPWDDILNALYTDGVVQIANLLPVDVVDKIKAEVDRNKKAKADKTKGTSSTRRPKPCTAWQPSLPQQSRP
jgi:hypothetical protein